MFDTTSLRAKLRALAVLGTVGTLLLGAIGYYYLGRSIEAAGHLVSASAVQRAQMDADMMHDAIRSDVYATLIAGASGNRASVASAVADLAEHGARFKRRIDEVGNSGLSPELTERVRALGPALNAFVASAQSVVTAAGRDRGAAAAARARFEEGFTKVEGEMEQVGDLVERTTRAIEQANSGEFRRAKGIVAASVVVIALLTLLIPYVVSRRLTDAMLALVERVQQLRNVCITELKSALEAMAVGDLSPTISPATKPLPVPSRDEVGILTETINDIILQTQGTVAAFETARGNVRGLLAETNRLAAGAKEGQLGERGRHDAFAGAFGELVRGFNETLDSVIAPVQAATVALERLADRDLTVRVDGRFRGDHARLQEAVNAAIDKLAEALVAVADTADGVASGASQIDGGSKELARGASDQAASLEEVSASARELAAMTKRNAASAAEGRSLAEGARRSTSEGVSEATRLAEAIARIKASAEATARIVRTIDEIAFQTNLLALNAAVEAARAGDSGKGFAVVADEVRSLAMRSAEAAKSTAQLIEESVKSTESGVQLNGQVLRQLHEIDERVNRVGQVVSEISAASDEQAKGVELIDRALEDMSLRTQAVAANADESEAASRALTEQSARLRELVGEFRLTRTTVPPAHARPGARVRSATPRGTTTISASLDTRLLPKGGGVSSRGPSRPAAASRAAAAQAAEVAIPLDDDDWNTVQNF